MPVAVSSTPPLEGALHLRGVIEGKEAMLAKFFATDALALGRLRLRNKSEDLPFAFYKICDLQDYGTSQN